MMALTLPNMLAYINASRHAILQVLAFKSVIGQLCIKKSTDR